ncbi:MAG: hypothetical protein RL140_558 [Actinomycetota bacterium]|jgi:hypothetical protein
MSSAVENNSRLIKKYKLNGKLTSVTFDVIFLFVSPVGGNRIYQLKQWIQPLQRLSKVTSLAVVTDNQAAADCAKEAGLVVKQYPSAEASVSLFGELEPKVILYPRKGYDSQLHTWYPNVFHVFIGHGESDKAYTADNHMRYFDYIFLAGEMGNQRLIENLYDYPTKHRSVLTGRPQLLDKLPKPPKEFVKNPKKKTILFTPTSDFLTPINQYGTIASHGVTLMETLLAAGDEYQVIYKPHPLMGSKIPENLAAHKRVLEMLESANSDHYYDTSPFGWQLDYADIMITDISAVSYDWLATGKPLVITKPNNPKAWIYKTGMLGAFDLLEPHEVPDILKRLEFESNDPATKASHESWRKRYYSDPVDDKGKELFIKDTLGLVKDWKKTFGSKPKVEAVLTKQSKSTVPIASPVVVKLPLKVRAFDLLKKFVYLALSVKAVSEQKLVYHFSGRPLKFAGLPAPAKDEKLALLIGSFSVLAATLKKTMLDSSLRGKYRIVFAPSGSPVRRILDRANVKEIFYTSHLRDNDFGLRNSKSKHVLLLDSLGAADTIDHNLVCYHEIVVTDKARAKQIESTVFKPEGWNFS